MDSRRLIRVLKYYKWTRDSFCGVYPINFLLDIKVKRPCSFIINTDNSSLPGQHWFAIYIPKKGECEYFDSYGLPPRNLEVYLFFKKHNFKWKYNKIHLQSNTSSSCGKFCVIFIAYRSKGLSLLDFISLFTKNKTYNERLINTLFFKLFNKNI